MEAVKKTIIPITEACVKYGCTRQFLYKIDNRAPILEKIFGKVFLNVEQFEDLAKPRRSDIKNGLES